MFVICYVVIDHLACEGMAYCFALLLCLCTMILMEFVRMLHTNMILM